jgi:hypothetical protein
MTKREKQRLEELELKAAYLAARVDEQEIQSNQIMARLVYLEAQQHRIMKEMGIDPEQFATPLTAQEDAKAINLTAVPRIRWN